MEKMTASDVMTRDVLTVGPDWPVERLVEFLTNHSISGAPVVARDGAPIGVVSLTDVARSGALTERAPSRTPAYYLQGLDQKVGRDELRSFHVEVESNTKVSDIMTSFVFSVDEQASVQEVATAMITGRIHRVLVTGGGKMVGIISSLDLLSVVRAM